VELLILDTGVLLRVEDLLPASFVSFKRRQSHLRAFLNDLSALVFLSCVWQLLTIILIKIGEIQVSGTLGLDNVAAFQS